MVTVVVIMMALTATAGDVRAAFPKDTRVATVLTGIDWQTAVPIVPDIGDSPTTSALVFFPGMSCNVLELRISNVSHQTMPGSCLELIPIGEWFQVWSLPQKQQKEWSDCMFYLLRVEYNDTNNTYHQPAGIESRVGYFGSVASVLNMPWGYGNLASFVKFFTAMPYNLTADVDLVVAGYDWRYGPPSLERMGYFTSVKLLIESVYARTKKRSMLVGHSNGGPVAYEFLLRMDSSWLDKYVSKFVPLSGNFIGEIDSIAYITWNPGPMFVLHNRSRDMELEMGWEANWYVMPFAGGYPNLTVATTVTDGVKRSYTSGDMVQFMVDNDMNETWVDMFSNIYPAKIRGNPGVSVHCMYGSGLPTDQGYEWRDKPVTSAASKTFFGDGDGSQGILDNMSCIAWNDTMPAGKSFQVTAFPGVDHNDLIDNTTVLAYVGREL
eukprot:TRINITY_DN4491_c0_g1_i4.p1 TRINITY_DN4491_c0_g1~~TRINITY_DN4491_c0_g1_i4.p1  ORF type:complete len:437 (+),score=46.29 TRINITY_DN4491_c0_g1_i4:139-1449(+)